jgi:hypothetical protein
MISTLELTDSARATMPATDKGTREAAPAPVLFFTIPSADADIFASLNERAQRDVKRRLKAMRLIHGYAQAKSVNYGCRTVAAMFHGERGWAAQTLNAIYCEFRDSGGDWKSLIDAAIAGPKWQNRTTPAGLADAFLDFLASEWALNQRDKFKAIHARLLTRLDLWRGGDESQAIPGYDEPPEVNFFNGLPDGWHYSNLLQAVKPRLSKFARTLIQRGPKAASQLGPKIISTRLGTEPGQIYVVDDGWNDFKLLAFGQTARLLSLHTLDLAAGCNILRGHKPALKDEKQTEERLREREMVWLAVTVLTKIGYHPRGLKFICEKATATFREREEQILADHCPEIVIERGPRGGGPGIAALFTGPGGGNPRWKAPLESWHNLLRNRTAGLLDFPGQTGSYSSGLPMPEGLPGLEKDTLALVKAARALPADRAELLRLGLLKLDEAIFALDAIIEVMCNCRTDHDLEGWRECGHYVTEWRANPQLPWQRVEALLEYAELERSAIAAQLANHPELKRERALSPREVFDAGSSNFKKIPLAVGALLMGDLDGAETSVKEGCLTLMVPEINPDAPISFGLTRRDGRGTEDILRDGQKFMVRVNCMDPRFCWLYNADGSFAGCAPLYARVKRGDTKGLQQAFARKQAALAPLRAEAQKAAAPLTQRAIGNATANVHLFDRTKPLTAAEKAIAQAVNSPEAEAAVEDLLAPAPAPVTPEDPAATEDFLDAISDGRE